MLAERGARVREGAGQLLGLVFFSFFHVRGFAALGLDGVRCLAASAFERGAIKQKRREAKHKPS